MPLELRVEPSGTVRPFWYGRFKINRQRQCVNLGVKVHGTPPASLSLKEEGDLAFERSRAAAQKALEHFVEEARTKRDSARLVERLYEIKTGESIQAVKLAELPQEWAKLPRKREPNARYAAQCQSTLRRFVAFVRQENSQATDVAQVTRTAARAFMEAEKQRGVTGKTWNDTLKLLRATFRYLLPTGAINPFFNMPTQETETVFRKPFTPEELKAILEAAREDEFIRPILVTGICTAMRRGDCCLLKWPDVDLARRFLTVKTAKTGQTVSIPIFPMLYEELAALSPAPSDDGRAKGTGRGEGHVFPEQARMYLENPDGITRRVRKVFAAAGFKDADAEETPEAGGRPGEAKSVDGEGAVVGGVIHMERKRGLRRASVRDFSSFRVTWVTLALTAGVALELVQKVTGHKTTDIVLKHYFQPGREAFRDALHSAMPRLLMNGQRSPKDEMRETLETMTARTWKRDKTKLLALLGAKP